MPSVTARSIGFAEEWISYYAKSSKWVENSSAVKDFIPKIEQETLVIVYSKARTGVFKGSAKSTPIGVRAKDNEFDLYYAMNAFSLWSEVDYEIDCDKVKVKPNFHFQDDYDWHVQWAAGGPNAGAAGLRDEWTQALADAGKAKTYVITGYWTGKEKQYIFPSNWLSLPILPPALQVIEIK